MIITDIHDFLKYYDKIKQRTRNLFEIIPDDKIEWSYSNSKFTIGDIIRHLALIERYMYAETVFLKPSRYKGCGIEYADGKKAVIELYNELNKESTSIFSKLTSADLQRKCKTPGDIEITTWKWLRAMVEHEIHHRGQLYTYLGILGIEVPPILGLTSEEVVLRSKG